MNDVINRMRAMASSERAELLKRLRLVTYEELKLLTGGSSDVVGRMEKLDSIIVPVCADILFEEEAVLRWLRKDDVEDDD